ncbi:site-specific integrase [Mameliella alba]|nr:site-specific integrase [Mameliella alba]
MFATKREAKDWAAREEYEIVNADRLAADVPFAEVLDRYAREVSPGKRSARWEMIKLENLSQDPVARVAIGRLSATDLGDWRDRRSREVKPGTVLREMGLLSAVLTQARREWGLISQNPMSDVRKPAAPQRRVRRVEPGELERLALSAGDDLSKATARTFAAFLFAIETGMRSGEILGLTWDRVDLEQRVATLPRTKNGARREVPLSREAVRILETLPQADLVFDLREHQRDALWRKLRDRAGVVGLNFHDSRHEAVTRLSRKLDVMALARMIGHRDIRQLMTYYEETAADLARRLD